MEYKLVQFDQLLKEINRNAPLECNLEKIVHDIEIEVDFQSMGIFLQMPNDKAFRLVSSRNLSEELKENFSLPSDHFIVKKLLTENSILLKEPSKFCIEKEYSELLLIALHYKKQIFGFFFIDKEKAGFTNEDMTKIEMFSSIISMQILVFMQQYEIEKLKKYDDVTQVFTYHSFLEQGRFLLNQMNRYHRNLTIVILRLFLENKKADEMLDTIRRKIAMALQSDLRESDIVGMIDMLTFAIFMPETSVSIIYKAIERLNKVLLSIPELEGHEINWGITGKNQHTKSIEDMIQIAIEAVEESELKEKDKITFY